MQEEIQEEINNYLIHKGIGKRIKLLPIAEHMKEFGDYCFIANPLNPNSPREYGEELGKKLTEEIESIEKVTVTQNQSGSKTVVYVNIKISEEVKNRHYASLIRDVIEKVQKESYGKISDNQGKVAIVEHTSANPISPIHVGNLRNSIQGDTFARILEHTGFTVFRHYYVNDGGLQIGFTVIGYEILKEAGVYPDIKFDRWLGQVYAIMNTLYTIQRLKMNYTGVLSKDHYKLTKADVKKVRKILLKKISELNETIKTLERENKEKPDKREQQKLKKQVRDYKRQKKKKEEEISEFEKYEEAFIELKDRFPGMFKILYNAVKKIDLVEKTSEYLQVYEQKKDQRVVDLFREMAMWTLAAFEWTLKQFNVKIDKFDFESELSWSGIPEKLVQKLCEESEGVVIEGKAVRYKYLPSTIKKMKGELKLSKERIPVRGHIPDLQLSRSDGTVLYAMKDVAYTIKKYESRDADVVYNVVGIEQALPQFQLIPLLYELGYKKYAQNLYHYGYEIVNLVGRTMSGRLAKYVTADQFFAETYMRARMAKRQSEEQRGQPVPNTEEEWREEEKILRAVSLAATRFPLVESSPNKRISLDLDRELDMKRNTGPFVLYAHARANGILQRIDGEENKGEKYEKLASDPRVITIIQHLDSLDAVLRRAVVEMDPSKVTDWCYKLAQHFMKFYETNPIIKEKDLEIRNARIKIVKAVKKGLATGAEILGLEVTNRI